MLNQAHQALQLTIKLNKICSIFLSMMLLASSCSKKKLAPSSHHNDIQNQVVSDDSFDSFEKAKNIDISIPLGFSIIKKSIHEMVEHFFLDGIDTLDHIKFFYTKEMERLGWEIIDLSTSDENLLICKNSKKYCVISARSDGNKNPQKIMLHLFLKKRYPDKPLECERLDNDHTIF